MRDTPGKLKVAFDVEWFPGVGDASSPIGRSEEVLTLVGPTWSQERDVCNAHLQQTFTIEDESVDHLRVRRDDTFSDVAAASACPIAAVPRNDCAQSTVFDEQLQDPCPSSCIELNTPTTLTQAVGFHCSC